MNRISIINGLIAKNNYSSYLEIGVFDGSCFNVINCANKIGVDPDLGSAATVHETSDEFFSKNEKIFDIVFIDGLHHADQVEKDIENALKFLSEGGTIVMHDCLPTSKRMQEIPREDRTDWTGDTWRAYLKNRTTRSDLSMCVVDTDCGCGIIRVGSQDLIVLDKLVEEVTYEDFIVAKNHWMNVISVDQFKQVFLS